MSRNISWVAFVMQVEGICNQEKLKLKYSDNAIADIDRVMHLLPHGSLRIIFFPTKRIKFLAHSNLWVVFEWHLSPTRSTEDVE